MDEDELERDLKRAEDSAKMYSDAVHKALKQNTEDINLRKKVYEQSMQTFKLSKEHMERQTKAMERIAKALERRK
jgi:hypothetical protein